MILHTLIVLFGVWQTIYIMLLNDGDIVPALRKWPNSLLFRCATTMYMTLLIQMNDKIQPHRDSWSPPPRPFSIWIFSLIWIILHWWSHKHNNGRTKEDLWLLKTQDKSGYFQFCIHLFKWASDQQILQLADQVLWLFYIPAHYVVVHEQWLLSWYWCIQLDWTLIRNTQNLTPKIARAMTILRPPLEGSRMEEFRSAWYIFISCPSKGLSMHGN